VLGHNGRWYQNITANPDAAIHVDGQRFAVHAVPVTDEALIWYGYREEEMSSGEVRGGVRQIFAWGVPDQGGGKLTPLLTTQ